MEGYLKRRYKSVRVTDFRIKEYSNFIKRVRRNRFDIRMKRFIYNL